MGIDDFVILVLIVFLVCVMGIGIYDLISDGNSDVLCKSNGYDYGTNLFLKNETVCTDIVQEEKLELTCIPSPCR